MKKIMVVLSGVCLLLQCAKSGGKNGNGTLPDGTSFRISGQMTKEEILKQSPKREDILNLYLTHIGLNRLGFTDDELTAIGITKDDFNFLDRNMDVRRVLPYPVDKNGDYVPYAHVATTAEGEPCRVGIDRPGVDDGEAEGLPPCPADGGPLFTPCQTSRLVFCFFPPAAPPGPVVEPRPPEPEDKIIDFEATEAAIGQNGHIQLAPAGVPLNSNFNSTELSGYVKVRGAAMYGGGGNEVRISWHIVQVDSDDPAEAEPNPANMIHPGVVQKFFKSDAAGSGSSPDGVTIHVSSSFPIREDLVKIGKTNRVVLVVDGGNSGQDVGVPQAIPEENDENNVIIGEVIKVGNPKEEPDFVIADNSTSISPTTVHVGEILTLKSKVRNIGARYGTSEQGGKSLSVNYSARKVSNGGDTLNQPSINLNSTSLTVFLDNGTVSPFFERAFVVEQNRLPPGTYEIYAFVDPTSGHNPTRGAVKESNEQNNEALMGTVVILAAPPTGPLPDLMARITIRNDITGLTVGQGEIMGDIINQDQVFLIDDSTEYIRPTTPRTVLVRVQNIGNQSAAIPTFKLSCGAGVIALPDSNKDFTNETQVFFDGRFNEVRTVSVTMTSNSTDIEIPFSPSAFNVAYGAVGCIVNGGAAAIPELSRTNNIINKLFGVGSGKPRVKSYHKAFGRNDDPFSILPSAVPIGGSYQFRFSVRNVGEGAAQGFKVRFTSREVGVPSGASLEHILGTMDILPLATGEKRNLIFTPPPLPSMPLGMYEIRVRFDAESDLEEEGANEINTYKSALKVLQRLPDFDLQPGAVGCLALHKIVNGVSVTHFDQIFYTDILEFSASVKNNGSIDASPSYLWSLKFLGERADGSPIDFTIKSDQRLLHIAPGQFDAFTQVLDAPGAQGPAGPLTAWIGPPRGRYKGLRFSIFGAIGEQNKSNNECTLIKNFSVCDSTGNCNPPEF